MPDIERQLKVECTAQCGRHTAEVHQAVRELVVTTSKKQLLVSNKPNENVKCLSMYC